MLLKLFISNNYTRLTSDAVKCPPNTQWSNSAPRRFHSVYILTLYISPNIFGYIYKKFIYTELNRCDAELLHIYMLR